METRPVAVILAGGAGSRLAGYPGPKCLVQIKGVPLLWRILESIEDRVSDVIVCTGHRSADVANSIQVRAKKPPVLSDSGPDATMAVRIFHALPMIPTKSALIMYGDTIADVDVDALLRVHEDSKKLVTMTVHQLRSPFGIAKLHGQSIVSFDEKPPLPHWYNIGYIVANRAALEMLGNYDLAIWFEKLAQMRELNAFFHRGRHFTVNTFKELEEMEAAL